MTDLLVDGNSLYARAWFATVSKTDNSPKDAIRAALNTVLSLLNVNNDKLGERIDRILFAWDGQGRPHKGREIKPAEYYQTRDLLVDYLSLLFNPAHAQLESREADDLVATAAKQSDADTIYVVSGDKDLQQLVNDRVQYYCLNSKALLSARAIRDKWHVKHPSQVAIALAIIGDKVDEIAGVRGWGPARVKKLFESATAQMTLEEAMCHVEQQMIAAQLPPEMLEEFYADMMRTTLEANLDGVPPAAPVEMASLDVVEELKLDGLLEFYRPIYRLYNGRVTAPLSAKSRPQRGSSSASRRSR